MNRLLEKLTIPFFINIEGMFSYKCPGNYSLNISVFKLYKFIDNSSAPTAIIEMLK